MGHVFSQILSAVNLCLQKLSSFLQVLGPKVILELSSKLHCYQVPQVLVSICLISAHKGGPVQFLKIRCMASVFFRYGEAGRTSKLMIM